MDKKMIVMIVLVVLVVIAAVQAFQLNEIKSSISEGGIKSVGQVTPTASSGGSPALPSALENLPTMVGGC